MTHYEPAETVLDALTDDALREQRTYKNDAAEELLRLPAAYRQPCEVEATRRSHSTIGDIHAARRSVIAEILAQLAREAA